MNEEKIPERLQSPRSKQAALNLSPSTVRNQLYRLSRQGLAVAARYTKKGKSGRLSKWWKVDGPEP
jgi:predicted ArsR family transcriptional regulator